MKKTLIFILLISIIYAQYQNSYNNIKDSIINIENNDKQNMKSIIDNIKLFSEVGLDQIDIDLLLKGPLLGTLLIIDADKNHNTPSMNYIIFKSISMICLFLIGYFIFEEVYNWKQIAGIGLIIVGITVLIINPL